jgi:hypothetical protein
MSKDENIKEPWETMEYKARQEYVEANAKYPEFAKILQHYGYDPLVYGRLYHTATWSKELILKKMSYIKDVSELYPNRKLRIVIDYDPEYPRGLCRVEQIPTAEEAIAPIDAVSAKELEIIEKL